MTWLWKHDTRSTLNVVAGDAMGAVMEDEHASMSSFIVRVAVRWCAEGVASTYLNVLAHGGVLLLVQMCLEQYREPACQTRSHWHIGAV